jgi:hypothetical protein
MVVLGLLLLVASVGSAVSIAVSNTDKAPFDVFGRTVTSLSPGGLMLLGLALGVAVLAGLWLMSAGMTRNRRRRAADRHEALQTRSRVDELEEENIRLRQVAERRDATSGYAAATGDYATDSDGTGAETSVLREGDATRNAVDSGGAVRSGTSSTTAAGTTGTGATADVYPDDSAYGVPPVNTPAYDDTARHHGNRVFGRRNK